MGFLDMNLDMKPKGKPPTSELASMARAAIDALTESDYSALADVRRIFVGHPRAGKAMTFLFLLSASEPESAKDLLKLIQAASTSSEDAAGKIMRDLMRDRNREPGPA